MIPEGATPVTKREGPCGPLLFIKVGAVYQKRVEPRNETAVRSSR
jgi:hypothetical protein